MGGVEITSRQRFLLHKLVEAHRELDQPVGSKWLADQDDVPWGPSTVRALDIRNGISATARPSHSSMFAADRSVGAWG